MIRRAAAVRETELAEERFNEALGELEAIDVYCLDPAKGLAVIPFRVGDEPGNQLAWFVFDLFAPQGLAGRLDSAKGPQGPRLPEQEPGLVDQVFASRPWFWERRPRRQRTNLE